MISQHRLSQPTPIRRSRRLNPNLEPESPKKENIKTQSPKHLKLKRQKSIPPKAQPSSPTASPIIRATVENFKDAYEDLNKPLSYSGDIKAIANNIPSYRLVDRLQKLARRLTFEND